MSDRYEIKALCPVHGVRTYTREGRPATAPRCGAEDRHRPSGRCDAYMSVLGARLLPADRRLIKVEVE